MSTAKALHDKHGGAPLLEIEMVAADYFHLSTDKFLRKVRSGQIHLPLLQMEPGSQKAKKFIAVTDLAAYIDTRHKAAQKELISSLK